MQESLYLLELNDVSDTIKTQKELIDKTLHDKLTGALNREFFEKNIINYNNIEGKFTAFGFVDIDHFKNINDTYGHDIGDITLKHLVKIITKIGRSTDRLIRWGGEEFIIILGIDNQAVLKKIMEKFRLGIELEIFPNIGHITCSFGATLYMESESAEEAIKRADKALYQSKQQGRNRISLL
jgi:diguanylate cyclase (GGDEF)-like protein